jgi:putative membrane protein
MTMENHSRDALWRRLSLTAGVVMVAVVGVLILGPRPGGTAGALNVSGLPTLNAALNCLTTVLLLVAFGFIRAGWVRAHRNTMLLALSSSGLFLVSYVIYHWFKAGPTPYLGAYRTLYLGILGSHVVLAMAIVPLVMLTVYRGLTDQRAKHRRIARFTLPLWLYVSVTGVIVYLMLY